MASASTKPNTNAQHRAANRPSAHQAITALSTTESASRNASLETSVESSERLVTRWLEKLLEHFGVRELGESPDQKLAALIVHYCEDDSDRHIFSKKQWLQDDLLLGELKRRVIRMAGAQLNDTFTAMAPDVVDLEDTEVISITAEGRTLRGVRYEGNIYRLIETFAPRHRLQAFCLAQTLNEQRSSYLITRSLEYFAVWVNIQASPRRSYTL